MENRCVISECSKTSLQCKLFKFPFENNGLLQKWLEKIPQNQYRSIENSSQICESHFDKRFIIFCGGVKVLHPMAVPTIFAPLKNNSEEIPVENSICRFCLRVLQDEEKQIAINAYIRKQFTVITQTHLNQSSSLSQFICEACFDSTRDLAVFKVKLIENQQILENNLNEDIIVEEINEPSNFIEIDTQNTPELKLEVISMPELKIEPSFEEQISVKEYFYEEHLDPDLDSELFGEKTPKKVFNIQNQYTEIEVLTSEDREAKVKIKGTSEKTKLCSECGKSYSSLALKRHFERVHLQLKNFYCDYCAYKTYSRSHMEIHVRSHLKIKTFSCEQCGVSFGSGNILRQHFLTHQSERPHKCDHLTCEMTFKSVYALRRHQKTHLDDRLKFECDQCSAKFIDRWHLKRHKESHQTQSHPCEICGKIFGTEDRLKSHQVYHRPPQFQCEICQKEFYKKPDWSSHLKTHTGQKDFQCNLCSNSYYKKSHLNRHQATHKDNL